MNFGKLRRTLNVLVEAAIKYNVYSGHLVLFVLFCFFCSAALPREAALS